MGRIADVLIDVEDMLTAGTPAEEIARKLNIPIDWVTQTEAEIIGLCQQEHEEIYPGTTHND